LVVRVGLGWVAVDSGPAAVRCFNQPRKCAWGGCQLTLAFVPDFVPDVRARCSCKTFAPDAPCSRQQRRSEGMRVSSRGAGGARRHSSSASIEGVIGHMGTPLCSVLAAGAEGLTGELYGRAAGAGTGGWSTKVSRVGKQVNSNRDGLHASKLLRDMKKAQITHPTATTKKREGHSLQEKGSLQTISTNPPTPCELCSQSSLEGCQHSAWFARRHEAAQLTATSKLPRWSDARAGPHPAALSADGLLRRRRRRTAIVTTSCLEMVSFLPLRLLAIANISADGPP
jgi:hypothetical protein